MELLKILSFDESKLKVFTSPEDFDEAFSKGTANGGIAAAFDEIPNTKLLLSKYCSKYTTVPPTYKAAGFGFVSLSLALCFISSYVGKLVTRPLLRALDKIKKRDKLENECSYLTS